LLSCRVPAKNHRARGGAARTVAPPLLIAVLAALASAWGVAALLLDNSRSPGSGPWRTSDEPVTEDSQLAGRLVALPPIAQPGNEPVRANRAETVLVAHFRSPRQGNVVLLEKHRNDEWQVLSSAEQDADGRALFTVPSVRPSANTKYRAVILNADGSRGPATTSAWDDWSPIFADDFNGDVLDNSKWMYRQLGHYNENGSRACSKSDERAVSVSDGTLELRVMADPEQAGLPCYTEHGTLGYYLNGHVATENVFDFKYGVAAARVKFPRGRGQHGAFWLQRNNDLTPGDPASSGAEIDVVEFFGEGYPRGGLASFLYYLNSEGENEKVGGIWPSATEELPPGDNWWRSYHVFSVEWTPKYYVFRVDGREIFRTAEGVSAVQQFLILSLLSSDWELPKLDESTLPTTMHVDWVRVWQHGPKPQG
jgi:beta-glucanase (GH16 family)